MKIPLLWQGEKKPRREPCNMGGFGGNFRDFLIGGLGLLAE